MEKSIPKALTKKQILLAIIDKKSKLDYLLKMGYTFSQIAQMMLQLEKDGLVCTLEDGIKLTVKGKQMLKRNNLFYISPYVKAQISKMSVDSIYVPKQKTLTKIGGKGNTSQCTSCSRDESSR